MKTTQNWNGFQFRWLDNRRTLLLRDRRIAIQTLMGPSDVVIVVDVFSEQTVQM